jgi:hypothetical protein
VDAEKTVPQIHISVAEKEKSGNEEYIEADTNAKVRYTYIKPAMLFPL